MTPGPFGQSPYYRITSYVSGSYSHEVSFLIHFSKFLDSSPLIFFFFFFPQLSVDLTEVNFESQVVGEVRKRVVTLTNNGALSTEFIFTSLTGNLQNVIKLFSVLSGRVSQEVWLIWNWLTGWLHCRKLLLRLYRILSFKCHGVYLIFGVLGAAFISKIKNMQKYYMKN